jgi:hypothetical protein
MNSIEELNQTMIQALNGSKLIKVATPIKKKDKVFYISLSCENDNDSLFNPKSSQVTDDNFITSSQADFAAAVDKQIAEVIESFPMTDMDSIENPHVVDNMQKGSMLVMTNSHRGPATTVVVPRGMKSLIDNLTCPDSIELIEIDQPGDKYVFMLFKSPVTYDAFMYLVCEENENVFRTKTMIVNPTYALKFKV